MKNNLLVTLADKNYIDQVKQLFSSAYWNAGWKGDYMLLSYEIPEKELRWFEDRRILIKNCKPLYREESNFRLLITLFKFYLFTPEFKRWENIIFLDADTIVRASLDDLTKIKGFAAVPDSPRPKLGHQFVNPKGMNKKLLSKLKKNYSLKETAFNSGLLVFSTDIIENETFSRLKKIFEIYKEIGSTLEQTLFNLFFYKKWLGLPLIYNLNAYHVTKGYNIKPEKVKGIILHFPGPKPWDFKDYFYREWKYNLERAEQIDLNKIQSPAKIWGKEEIEKYCSYLKRKHVIFLLDRYVGRAGIFLKNNFPKLYFILKDLKNGKADCFNNN